MARQIDLQDLYNRGALIVSLVNPGDNYVSSENGGDGIASMFDGDQSTNLRLTNTISDPSGAPFEFVNLNFQTPIQAKKIKIRFRIAVTEDATLYINYGLSGIHSSQQSVAVTLEGGSSFDTTDSFFNLTSFGEIFSIGLELGNSYLNIDHFINKIQLYIEEEIENKTFEFNDSVLETKAWNSSRYSGKQLQASTINEFTNGDTTYGKTPVLQNYTRNIYLGSRVVGMNSSSIDDGTLTHFEGFSYVTMHEYLTINDDLSITRRSIRGNDETNIKKKGFYRSFYHDFPINSEAEIKLFDETIDDNLKSSYNIFNNSGQLQKLLLIERHDADNTGSGYGVRYSGSNQLFYATSSTQNDLRAEFTIYNQQLLIDNFFTGSLISTPPAWTGGSNPDSDLDNP